MTPPYALRLASPPIASLLLPRVSLTLFAPELQKELVAWRLCGRAIVTSRI